MSNQINDALPVVEGQEENGRDAADYLSFRPGQRLRKARELRGMSIEQVARELALSPRYVEAMESDVYKSLPEPAFVRGYMRRYAQLVKLSPDDIAAKFDQCYAEDKETPPLELRPKNPVQLLGELARRPRFKTGRLLSWAGILFIIVLVAGVLWSGISSRMDSLPMTDAPALGEVAPEVPAVPEVIAPGVPASQPATQVPAPATQAPQPVTRAPVPVTQAPLPATQAPLPATPAPSVPGMNVLPAPSSPPVLPAPGGATRAVPLPAPTLQQQSPAPQPAPQPRR